MSAGPPVLVPSTSWPTPGADDAEAWVCLRVDSTDLRVVVPFGDPAPEVTFGSAATWHPDEGTRAHDGPHPPAPLPRVGNREIAPKTRSGR